MRLKGLALGVAVGGAMCLPLGYVTTELDRLIPSESTSTGFNILDKATPGSMNPQSNRDRDLTGDAIKSFERELRERAPRKKKTMWTLWR